ncbi:MAG: hypothetical protein Q4G68_01585 [Planctomycetia bacterium]|nr:hypothetical protein [Planctomycetia bacterium]
MSRALPLALVIVAIANVAIVNRTVGQESNTEIHLEQYLSDMTPSDFANGEQVQKMETAQTAWMDYCLKVASAPEKSALLRQANREMLDALQTEGQLEAKVWLLHLLGWTGTDDEVSALAALLNSDEIRLADEAARALAEIQSPAACAALQKGLDTVTAPGRKELLAGVLAQLNVDLTVASESELPMAIPTMEEEAVQQYLAQYDSFSLDDQVRTLASLTVRKDPALLPLARKALDSDNEDLVAVAIFALEKVGTPDDILGLTRFFGTRWEQQVMLVATRYPGSELDSAITAQLQDPATVTVIQLARIAANRNLVAALPLLLQRVASVQGPDRITLLSSAAQLAKATDVPLFVDALLATDGAKERDEIEKLISGLSAGNGSHVMQRLNEDNAAVLLPLLGRIGGTDSLNKLRDVLATPGESAQRNYAVRGLCNWPNAEVAADLVALIENKDLPEALRVPALRAYIRVMTLPDDQIGITISVDERLESLRKAMNWSSGTKEKTLVIRRASAVRSPRTLAYILEFADNAELKSAVLESILDLAHHDFLRKEDPNAFRAALDLVLKESTDAGQKDRAQRYRDTIPAATNP